MRCEVAQRELSARLDGAPNAVVAVAVDEHVTNCATCRHFETASKRLRHAARAEVAPPIPDGDAAGLLDMVNAIMDAVATDPGQVQSLRTMRSAYRVAFIGLAGAAAVAITALALSVRGPSPGAQRTEAIRILSTRTLLAWTPVQVRDELARDIARVEGVAGLTQVRSGVVWLDTWTDSAGRRRRPPEGMRIPIEVAAIDNATYARFVPASDRETLSSLEEGGVILGEGGAALRGIDTSGSLTFGRARLDVRGILADHLIGAHEAVVSASIGRDLSIDRVRYLLVELTDDASADAVVRRIRSLTSTEDPIRVRTLGETPQFRHGDAVLPPIRIKKIFGEFAAAPTVDGNLRVDGAWTDANITSADVPILGSVRCHRRIVSQLRDAMDEISRKGLAALIDRDDFGGCFVPRFLSRDKTAGISHHSWGIAFDLNVEQNPFGKPARLDPRVVKILERWGFGWGGRWLVPDGMHFEFLRDPLF